MAAAGKSAIFAGPNVRKKMEPAMHIPTTGTDQSERSPTNAAWEKRVENSMQGIVEILGENVKWWEQAAVTCEHTAARLPMGEREGWQLMGAVYRERAEKHSHLVEQLLRQSNATHG
jgi:hypothetical protein